jgi:hypothetical protein
MEEREQYGHADHRCHCSYERDEFREQNERRPALRVVLGESVVKLHADSDARFAPTPFRELPN